MLQIQRIIFFMWRTEFYDKAPEEDSLGLYSRGYLIGVRTKGIVSEIKTPGAGDSCGSPHRGLFTLPGYSLNRGRDRGMVSWFRKLVE